MKTTLKGSDCSHLTLEVDTTLNEKIAIKSSELESWCARTSKYVSPDRFVRVETAAFILDKSPDTLKNWRNQNMPLPARKVMGRWQYKLDDLAALLLLNE